MYLNKYIDSVSRYKKKIKTLTKQIKTTFVSCSFKENKYVKQKKRPCLVGYFMLYTSDDSN